MQVKSSRLRKSLKIKKELSWVSITFKLGLELNYSLPQGVDFRASRWRSKFQDFQRKSIKKQKQDFWISRSSLQCLQAKSSGPPSQDSRASRWKSSFQGFKRKSLKKLKQDSWVSRSSFQAKTPQPERKISASAFRKYGIFWHHSGFLVTKFFTLSAVLVSKEIQTI